MADVTEEPEPTPEPTPVEEVHSTLSRPPIRDLRAVKYLGNADVRELSEEDLRRVGIEDPKGPLRFERSSNHEVDISEVNAATADWLATQDDFDLI